MVLDPLKQLEQDVENLTFHSEKEEQVEIVVSQIIDIGSGFSCDNAIVEDMDGRRWVIPESPSCDNGLISRWDLRSGMRLILTIRERFERETEEAIIVDTGPE